MKNKIKNKKIVIDICNKETSTPLRDIENTKHNKSNEKIT